MNNMIENFHLLQEAKLDMQKPQGVYSGAVQKGNPALSIIKAKNDNTDHTVDIV